MVAVEVDGGRGCGGRRRRDLAQDGALGLVRKLVPSEEWLQGAFWRRQADSTRQLLRRALSVALDDGEGDLDDWLDQQVPPGHHRLRNCHPPPPPRSPSLSRTTRSHAL